MFIYLILNNITQMGYVGKSTKLTFKERYRNGRWWSRTHNKYLKRAAKKHGKHNFNIVILEQVSDIVILTEREEYWIKKLDCYYPNGYNFPFPSVVEINGKSYEFKNIKTGKIIQITNLTEFCEINNIGVKAMNSMLIGRQKQSHGYCLLDTDISSLEKKRKNPICLENIKTDEKVEIHNLSQFCRERGLIRNSLARVIDGYKDRKSYKGWKLLNTQLKTKYKNFYICSPDGNIIFVEVLPPFCKKHNLCYNNMFNVVSGKYRQYKGWSLPEKRDPDKRWKGQKTLLLDPLGQTVEIDNVSKFCKEYNLGCNSIHNLLHGKISDYKGYKLKK
jgi:hypothetical protein